MTVDTDLWTEASRDLEAEHAQLRLFAAQQRVADLWPFVALARSPEELGHRLALIQDTLIERVPDTTLHEALIEGLTANKHFQGYATDLGQDGDEDDAPRSSTSGLLGDGSGLADQDGTPDLTASHKMQIWHAGKRGWLTVTSAAPGNPDYFSGGPEAGPNTGQTGTFPVETDGPDPWDPINGALPLPPTNVVEPANRFPAEPQPWTVPPDKGWVEHPMQLAAAPRQGRRVRADTPPANSAGFQPEQANPYYFAEGQTGLESEESAGFPVDLALSEPDERVDMYRDAVPLAGGQGGIPAPGAFAGPAVNFTNPPQYVTSARSNVAACATCGRPAYREGRKWHHLDAHLRGDHNVMLDSDHPWVTEQMARTSVKHTIPDGKHAPYRIRKVQGGYAIFEQNERRTEAMPYSAALKIKQANQYIKPNPDGDGFVITQKGTGKILSHHDSEEKAEAAFRAMEWHKHEGRFIRLADGTDPSAAATVGLPSTSNTPMQSPAPTPPPSMTQGAPGAEAMPSTPNGGSNVPTPTRAATALLDPSVAALFRVGEDMVRGRPTSESPTGVPDEYTANTWEGPLSTHPRQTPEQRGINTPQTPGMPIPQVSSSDNPGQHERAAQEDEDDDED